MIFRSMLRNNKSTLAIKLNVHYISNSSINLLSISLFEKRNIHWNIRSHELILNDKIIVYISRVSNNFYVLKLEIQQMTILSIFSSNFFSIWHRRLRHISYSNFRIYLNRLNISYFDDCLNDHCDSCKLIKIKKKLNKIKTYEITHFFYIIHIDLMFIKIIEFEDERYYVIFTNYLIR